MVVGVACPSRDADGDALNSGDGAASSLVKPYLREQQQIRGGMPKRRGHMRVQKQKPFARVNKEASNLALHQAEAASKAMGKKQDGVRGTATNSPGNTT